MPLGVADSSPRPGRRAGSSLAHLSFVSSRGVPRSGGARRGVRFGAPPTAAGEVNQRRGARPVTSRTQPSGVVVSQYDGWSALGRRCAKTCTRNDLVQ
jgi:hypothetical protein